MIIINIFKHLKTVLKHKWIVFKLCLKAGIPFRGIVHDMSKFSPTEFWESVKYYQGTISPIVAAKRANGYSKAWLHHKGRNKHHPEYWNDPRSKIPSPIMPYKYAVEMVCDTIAAGIVYNADKWKTDSQLRYWEKEKSRSPLNENLKEFLTEIYIQVSQKGVEPVITSKNLKNLYKKYCSN